MNILINNQKKLIIAPYQYHSKILNELLGKDNVIYNIDILSVDTFLKNTLSDYNLKIEEKNNIIEVLELSDLINVNNINQLNDLLTLKKEFKLSNISLPIEYEYLNSEIYSFEDITSTYDEIIIYTTEDFYPIHFELMSKFKDIIINYSFDLFFGVKANLIQPIHHLYEHDNNIKMIDYIINELYQLTNYDDILIICDDLILKDYFTNQLDILHIPYQKELVDDKNQAYLISLFKYLNNDYHNYDLINILKLHNILIKKAEYLSITNGLGPTINKEVFERIDDLINNSFKTYIEKLYMYLIEYPFFDINKLNDLFKELYLVKSDNIYLLNNLLTKSLCSCFNKSSISNGLMITTSSACAYPYQKAYIIDATLSQFNASKTSYLLNTKQRHEINPNLISNTYYTKQHKLKQLQLLNNAHEVSFHYALVSSNNKPQNLAFFISSLNLKPTVNLEYYHLNTFGLKNDSLLLTKESANVSENILLTNYINKTDISASHLDCFKACPYQYFIRYLIKPKLDNQFKSMHLGSIAHLILEEINNDIINNNSTYQDYHEDRLTALIDQVLFENKAKMLDPYYLTNASYYLIRKHLIETIQINVKALSYLDTKSKFRIQKSEISIYSKYQNKQIIGKIDALYQYQDYNYVLDYKSSVQDFKQSDFKAGIKNQLMMYLYLLKNNKMNISGAFFKSLKYSYLKTNNLDNQILNQEEHLKKLLLNGLLIEHPYITSFDDTYDESESSLICNIKNNTKGNNNSLTTFEKLNENFTLLESFFDDYINTLNNGHFAILPYQASSCNYCEYHNICKHTQFDETRKELDDE